MCAHICAHYTPGVEIFVGTSGYSYKEWKGSFYPEKLPAKAMLGYYAEHFRAVEINNTFYRMPRAEVLSAWAAEVPERFTFVLKAPQRITHVKRLKDAGDDVGYFLDIAKALGEHLGPVLFQLPPFARKDPERLAGFVRGLPAGRRYAFEFRHPSWFTEDVYAILRDAGCALCLADVAEEKDETEERDETEQGGAAAGASRGDPGPGPSSAIPELIVTADFGYLRLRRCDYDAAALAAWRAKVEKQPWQAAYVFFKHEDEGTGPKLAKVFEAARAP